MYLGVRVYFASVSTIMQVDCGIVPTVWYADFFYFIIPKRISESVNRRKSDNTLTKGKKDMWTNNDVQNTTQKTKD